MVILQQVLYCSSLGLFAPRCRDKLKPTTAHIQMFCLHVSRWQYSSWRYKCFFIITHKRHMSEAAVETDVSNATTQTGVIYRDICTESLRMFTLKRRPFIQTLIGSTIASAAASLATFDPS